MHVLSLKFIQIWASFVLLSFGLKLELLVTKLKAPQYTSSLEMANFLLLDFFAAKDG
jgi:hypothetical protein